MRAEPEGLDDAKVEAEVLELRVVQQQNGGRPLFLECEAFYQNLLLDRARRVGSGSLPS